MSEEHKVIEAPVTVIAPTELADKPKVGDLNIAPTTTAAEDLIHEGQRQINRLWEYTQSIIALLVVVVSLGVGIIAQYKGDEVSSFIAFICGNVVGFYFSRTNHAAIGGIGKKPVTEYEGR